MSLTVKAVQLEEDSSRRASRRFLPIEGAPKAKAVGFESWRTDVWASRAVISLAEAVRSLRPSRLILPSLAAQDIIVEGEELHQLEREVDALLADAPDVVRKIRLTAPMLGGIFDESGHHTPSESEIVEDFRTRLLNIKEAVQLAKTVPRGAVWIS